MLSRFGTSTNLAVLVAVWAVAKHRMVPAAAHLLGHLQQGTQRPDTCRYARLAGRRTRTDQADRFRVHRVLVRRHPHTVHLRERHTAVATKPRILVLPAYTRLERL